MALADLCQQMFEMVQYKNYHAELSPPYPLDGDAATWVRDHAEPNGIVDKKRGIFVDSLPFFKPGSAESVSRIHIMSAKQESSVGAKIKFHRGSEPLVEPEARPVVAAAANSIACPGCGT